MGPINPDTIIFDAPAQFVEDNSSIPPGTITKYQYGFSQTAGGPYTKLIDDTDLAPTPQGKQTADINLSGFAFGQWYAAARAVSKDGPISAWSNEFAFVVQALTPKPPANFSIG